MSQQPRRIASRRQRVVRVAKPNAGEKMAVNTAARVQLDFDTDEASFDRVENDLVIKLDDGGVLTITDFFVTNKAALPVFVMVDGKEVSSQVFLAAEYPEMDLTTAAGPTQSSPDSGGEGEYSDSAGDLIGGVDRLGTLGTTRWASSFVRTPDQVGAPLAPAGLDPDRPRPASGPYQARAILYTHGATGPDMGPGSAHSVTTQALENTGSGWAPSGATPSVAYDGGWNPSFINVVVNADGTMSFTLNEAGLAFMRSTGREFLDFYFKVTLPGGDEYIMQVIIADNMNFDSGDCDAWVQDNANIWGSIDSGGLVHGEWHEGLNTGTDHYDVVSSDLGDQLSFKDTLINSSVNTAAGDDKMSVTEDVIAQNAGASVITLGDGDDTLSIGGNVLATGDGSTNTTTGGDGFDLVTIDGQVHASEGGKNTIDTGQSVSGTDMDEIIVKDIVFADGSGNAAGVSSENELVTGKATIGLGKNVALLASIEGQTDGSAKNRVDVSEKLTIEVESAANEAFGVYAYVMNSTAGHAENLIEGNDVDITAVAEKQAYGFASVVYNSQGTAKNAMNTTGRLDIKANANTQAAGILAQGDGASNDLTAGSVSLNVGDATYGATAGLAAGVMAWTKGVNTVTAATIDINAYSDAKAAYGMFADGGGKNVLNGDVLINVSAENQPNSKANGIYTGVDSFNEVNGAFTVFANHEGTAYGIENRGETTVTSGGKDININVGYTPDPATGDPVQNYGTGEAYGIKNGYTSKVTDPQRKVVLDAEDGAVNIRVSAADSAYGAHASYNSATTIKNASSVNIEAYSQNGSAYGLFSSGVGSYDTRNEIIAGANSMSVHLTAAGVDAASSYAMYAENGGLNLIKGGVADDDVTLDAKMFSTGVGSHNEITLGDGYDSVTVNTVVHAEKGGKNTIDTGQDASGTQSDEVTVNGYLFANGSANKAGEVSENELITGNALISGGSLGMLASIETETLGTARNRVDASGKLTINVSSADAEAFGAYAYVMNSNAGLAENVIEGANADITASAERQAYGMAAIVYNAQGTAKNTVNLTGTLDIKANANTGQAAGLFVQGEGASSDITANRVAINVGDVANGAAGALAAGVMAWAKGENVVTADTIEIKAYSDGKTAHGMYADTGGKNVFNGDVLIDVAAVNSSYHEANGLYTAIDSYNEVNGALTVFANHEGKAHGIKNTGNTTISSGGKDVNIFAGYTSDAAGLPVQNYNTSEAYGIRAGMLSTSPIAPGTVVVNAQGGKVDVRASASNSAYALYSSYNNTTSIRNASVVNLEAYSKDGVAYGMFAAAVGASVGRNEILAGDNAMSVTIKAEGVDSSKSYAMYAQSGGANAIRGGDQADTVTIHNKIYATGSGSLNEIHLGKGADTLTVNAVVEAEKGGLNRLQTYNAMDTTTADEITINGYLYANGSGNAAGVSSINGVYASNVTINSTAQGLYAYVGGETAGTGQNSIQAAEKLSVNVHGSGIVRGIGAIVQNSQGGLAENMISSGKDVDISVSSTNGQAYGIFSQAYGASGTASAKNTISITGNLDIKANAGSPQTAGVYAAGEGAFNTITAKSVGIDVGNAAHGVTGALPAGLMAWENGQNIITADTIQISSFGTGTSAYGLYATSGGKNVLNGDVRIEVGGANSNYSQAVGLYTTFDSYNEVNGALDVFVNHKGGYAYGMYDNGFTTVSTGGGDVRIYAGYTADAAGLPVQNSDASNASGIRAGGHSSPSTIPAGATVIDTDGGAVDIRASGTGTTYATSAWLNNTLTIKNASTVNLEAYSTNGRAHGMHAAGSDVYTSRNEIIAGDGPLTLTIKAQGNSANNSYALLADNGGTNYIEGSDYNDSIILQGSVSAWNANSSNEISLGAGDDYIEIDGQITSNAPTAVFNIDGGSGYDVLALCGETAVFWGRYGSWLDNLNNYTDIEAIQFKDIDFTDANATLLYLANKLGQAGIDVIWGEYGDASSIIGGAAAHDHISYADSFDSAVNLGDDTISFESGSDKLSFTEGLSNGDLDMGAGNDMVSISKSLQNVDLDMGNGNDHLHLDGVIKGSSLSGGAGMDVLHLESYGNVNLNTLNGTGNSVRGFEVIDLTGGKGTELTIDSLLSNLEQLKGTGLGDDISAMRVLGDANDTVKLGSSWAASSSHSTVEYGGVVYNVYENSANDSEYLLVQQQVVVQCG